VLDPAEIPPGELEQRVAALQQTLAQRGLAAALVYADVFHSGDVTYLSNICLYWNEAVLAVPAAGRPALLTKLSRRVHPWMRATSNLDDLRSGPRLAALAAQYLGELPPGGIGLAEKDWWPAQIVEDLAQELPGRDLSDLGSVVRRRRQVPSEPEVTLLRRASALTAGSVASGLGREFTNHERAGRAELTARRGGAEDVNVYCHSSTPDADTIEVVSEYRGYWTGAARVLARPGATWASSLAAAYQAASSELRAGATRDHIAAAAQPALTGSGLGWQLDLIHHTDLETDGGYRTSRQRAEPVPDRSVVTLRLELELPGGSSAALADTFLVAAGSADCLTSGPSGPVNTDEAA
jgi:hypothetical protein